MPFSQLCVNSRAHTHEASSPPLLRIHKKISLYVEAVVKLQSHHLKLGDIGTRKVDFQQIVFLSYDGVEKAWAKAMEIKLSEGGKKYHN